MSDPQGHSPSGHSAAGQETPGPDVQAAGTPVPSTARNTPGPEGGSDYADRSYRSLPTLLSGVLLLALTLWFCGDAILGGHGQAPWYGVAALVLLFPLISAFTLLPVVRANPDRLLVRNPFRIISAPWSQVESIQAALSVELVADGKKYQLWAVPVSMRQRKRASRRAMKDGMPQRTRRSRGGDPRYPAGGPGLRSRVNPAATGGYVGSDSVATTAWADRTVEELRELGSQAEGRPTAVGPVSVAWTWWIVAPIVVGALAIVVLAIVG